MLSVFVIILAIAPNSVSVFGRFVGRLDGREEELVKESRAVDEEDPMASKKRNDTHNALQLLCAPRSWRRKSTW